MTMMGSTSTKHLGYLSCVLEEKRRNSEGVERGSGVGCVKDDLEKKGKKESSVTHFLTF